MELGITSRIVQLLAHESSTVRVPILRTVGNIINGSDSFTQTIIDAGALSPLLDLVQSPTHQREACWTISNITAQPAQIQAVIDAGLIPPILEVLRTGELKARREACWAVSNATLGWTDRPQETRYLVSQGCIKPMCDILASTDDQIISIGLDGLLNILKVGEMDRVAVGSEAVNAYAASIRENGAVEVICELRQHFKSGIRETATTIVKRYFSEVM